MLREEGDLAAAHDLADQGATAFPETFGGKFCFNLLREIEAKSCQVTTERVWNEPWPMLRVQYRNLTQIHFRAVRCDYIELLKGSRNRPEFLDPNRREALLAKKPDLQWSAELRATSDFQERVEELPSPKDLKPGFYFIIASGNPQFSAQNNQVSFADVWVSNLAIVMRTRWGQDLIGGFVLDAISGEPIADADVQVWCRTNWNSFAAGPKAKTDQNGLFSLRHDQPGLHRLRDVWGPATCYGKRISILCRLPPGATLRSYDLLHGPLALPPGTDDPLQGDRDPR